ncbi:TetR family transcriptional regulator [Methylobacterium sp. Leaf102]|jgi:AcrR family transcriptional regulator|nr:TetR family transcriptional regulator [Methylobacterium sp. Leaf102]
MGRRKTIDRDKVLEVAEEVVASRGASGLTIDAVAKAAGITKGGVQSCFGTKEALIAAMLRRWLQDYEERVVGIVGTQPTPLRRVQAHVETTRVHDEGSQARAAALLALLLQTPEHLADTRRWYEEQVAGLDRTVATDRRARLAFLATEGAFFLRFLGLMPIDRTAWDAMFLDIQELLETSSPVTDKT